VREKRFHFDDAAARKRKDVRSEHIYPKFSGCHTPGSDHFVVKHRGLRAFHAGRQSPGGRPGRPIDGFNRIIPLPVLGNWSVATIVSTAPAWPIV
jgi:hypothetical protein